MSFCENNVKVSIIFLTDLFPFVLQLLQILFYIIYSNLLLFVSIFHLNFFASYDKQKKNYRHVFLITLWFSIAVSTLNIIYSWYFFGSTLRKNQLLYNIYWKNSKTLAAVKSYLHFLVNFSDENQFLYTDNNYLFILNIEFCWRNLD